MFSWLWALQFHEASHPGIQLTIHHVSDPPCIHQSDHLSLHPSAFHLSIQPTIPLSIMRLSIHLSVYPSVNVYIHPSIHPSIHSSIPYPSFDCLSVHPSMCPLINVSTHPPIHFCHLSIHSPSVLLSTRHLSIYPLSTFPPTHTFVPSFNKYLLSTHSLPGPVLGRPWGHNREQDTSAPTLREFIV